MTDEDWLKAAIEQSRTSAERGGFPVGAILVGSDGIAASGISDGKQQADPTSHAETTAIRMLCAQLGQRNLKNYTLYSSMEPCLMCYGAAFWASIPKIVFAARKTKLSWQHSEGQYDLAAINSQTRRPLTLIHLTHLEPQALDVINTWEQSHPAPAIISAKRGD